MPFVLRATRKWFDLDERATQEMVKMSDGVALATDVYLPATPKRHGTILVRTPYDKTGRYNALPQMARHFTDLGYAFVAQDCRGKNRSEGATMPYQRDVTDAYATVDWIASQPWSNGRVGLWGASYYGYTAWCGVASGHPAVRAAIPAVTNLEMQDTHMASRWTQIPPNLWGAEDLIQNWTDKIAYVVDIDYSRAPVVDALAEATKALGGPNQALNVLLEKARSGGIVDPFGDRHPYWTTGVPILHWSGWFDVYNPEQIADWRHFRSLTGRRELHYLRADSADHAGNLLANLPIGEHGDRYTSDAALEELLDWEVAECARFFDPYVRDVGEPLDARRRAKWNLGHVGYFESDDWPPAGQEMREFYFANGEQAAGGGGGLADRPDAHRAVARWTHDPDNPVPSPTPMDDAWLVLRHYPDMSQLGGREDVLTFTSEPFAEPVDIVGTPRVQLGVGSTGPSMHVFGRLQDVDPDGRANPISSWQVVIGDPDPDRVVQLDLSPLAYRIRPRHRLRLQLASSDHPYYLVHPGTDENPWFAATRIANEQTLVTGGSAPSRLELPIMRVLPERTTAIVG